MFNIRKFSFSQRTQEMSLLTVLVLVAQIIDSCLIRAEYKTQTDWTIDQ